MAEMQPWERIVERNRMAETLQRNAYRPQGERLELIEDAGQLDKVQQRIAELQERDARIERRLAELEARLLQDETNAAWHGFAGFAERLAALESRMNEADEGAAKLQELAIARANR